MRKTVGPVVLAVLVVFAFAVSTAAPAGKGAAPGDRCSAKAGKRAPAAKGLEGCGECRITGAK